MAGQTEAAANATDATKVTRQRSSISFPYMDLKSAIELAEAIHGNVGLAECDDDQLAAWSKQSAKSSTFRVQVYAARTFGILEGEGGRHKLSSIGRAIVDPNQTRQAKAQAFLAVPLFKAIYDKYKGGVLPPAAALERDIVSLGVAEKQKGRARNIFEKSAEQAGFFEHGKNHLVMPGVRAGVVPPKTRNEQQSGGTSGATGNRPVQFYGGGGDEPPDLHPFIDGLLKSLPAVKIGEKTPWPIADQVKWLQTAASIFGLIYESDDGRVKVEQDG